MRNIKPLLFIAAFIFVSLGAAVARPVHAATGTGDIQLDTIIDKLAKAASDLNDEGYTVVHITIDNGLKGEKYTATRNLYSGNDYKVIGVGGDGISDLDIALLDKDDNVVDKDTEDDAKPQLEASVSKDGQYFFQTTITELDKGEKEDDSYFYGYVLGFKQSDQPTSTGTSN